MTKRAALILAGGKAERFQTENQNWRDKALAKLSGKPLLIHAIENVSSVVDEVIVCVNDEARKERYLEVLAESGFRHVKLVTDEKIEGVGGPILAILTGLKATDAEYCITIPADMPLLNKQVANYLFNHAKYSNVVVPMWPNGKLETLVMVLKRYEILNVTSTLIQLNRTRPLDIIRAALKVLFVSPIGEIRPLDPTMKSFVNINCPQDLDRLQPRLTEGPVTEDLQLNLVDLPLAVLQILREASAMPQKETLASAKTFATCAKRLEEENLFFWAALCRENEGKIKLKHEKNTQPPVDFISGGKTAMLQAAEDYANEAKIYEKNRVSLLAERARADQSWCQSTASKA